MEPAWNQFDFAIDITNFYAKKKAAMQAYAAVFSGQQEQMLGRVEAADRYYGGLVGVDYAEIFGARSPLLVDEFSVFAKARFG